MDEQPWGPKDFGHEIHDRITSLTSGHEALKVRLLPRQRSEPAILVSDIRRFIKRQLADASRGLSGPKHQATSGRHPEHKRGAAADLNQCLEIFDLTLDSVGQHVATLGATPTIVCVHGELLSQERSQLRRWPVASEAEGTVHEDQRWALPQLAV